MSALALDDIQGNVLRGYRAGNARHFAVRLPDPGAGRALLARLLDGEPPCLTDARHWRERPDHLMNLGITWSGLGALGVTPAILSEFPPAFRAGPAARATTADPDFPAGAGVGDVGGSAPQLWELGGPAGPDVHLLASLFTDEHRRPARERLSAALRAAFGAAGAEEVWSHDADALPGGRVHFGYRDGISQPQIAGAPGRSLDDAQGEVPAGDLLLGAGQLNSYGGNHLGAIPHWLGDNGTYAAVRVLAQDCAAFEATLDRWAAETGAPREWLAAKVMGRWRDGTPLATHPDGPAGELHGNALNAFDYAPSAGWPMAVDDTDGRRCPAGSHIRRCHPRSAPSLGLTANHRIVRRGMPFGPPFDPRHPDDGADRGLIGLFLCADLELGYEFVLRTWANGDLGAPGLRGTRDPVIGAQPDGGGHLLVPLAGRRDPLVLSGLPQLTRTRGSLYCLLPGIGALRRLSEGDVAG